jgi:PIN domain nuclease of toxin-antitoxin system
VKYLLDTNVLIQSLVSKPKLNHRALTILQDESSELYLSAVSAWEIMIKAGNGKLVLPERPAEFVARAMRIVSLRSLDITYVHALATEDLPSYHRDPFDRMLIAQTKAEGMVLLTLDRVLERYKVEQLYCGR